MNNNVEVNSNEPEVFGSRVACSQDADIPKQDIALVVVAIALALLFYLIGKVNHYYDGHLTALHLNSYVQPDSKELVENVVADLNNCEARSHNWFFDGCDDLNRDIIKSVIETSIQRNELDRLWDSGLRKIVGYSPLISDFMIYQTNLNNYETKVPELRFKRGLALLGAKEVPTAYKVFLSLHQSDYADSAAGYIRGIFKFYGCETEHEIWGEITIISNGISSYTRTEQYPSQEKMPASFIVEKRTQLAGGDTNIVTPSCPLHKSLVK